MALTFCESEERADWRNIVKLTRQDIPVVDGHPYQSRVPLDAPIRPSAPQPQRSQGSRNGSGNGHRRRRR